MAWPADLAFEYVTVPALDARKLGREARVLIGGENTDSQRAARGITAETPRIAIAVRSLCQPEDFERFQRLQSIAYTVCRKVLAMTRDDLPNATPMICKTVVSHDIDKLRAGEFITVRTVELAARRAI